MKFFLLGTILLAFLSILPTQAHAELPDQLDYKEIYSRGLVTQVLQQGIQQYDSVQTYNQTLRVQLLDGTYKGKIVTVGYSGDITFGSLQKIKAGEEVVVDIRPSPGSTSSYTIYEPYRLTGLWWVLGAFIVLVLLVTGLKGLSALIGMTVSLLTISLYVIPNILSGQDPLSICLSGAIIILLLTTYIAHGISIKTTMAVFGTASALLLALLISVVSVHFLHLFGLGNQDVYDLQLGTSHKINPQGLLLGSIIIGALGALNDITTTQAITIFTLAKENPKQRFQALFRKGMHIGREHIASLINTLVLAYAGSSLAIFIFFSLNPANLPWWLILNDETTMEEIIRTLVGSSALILAVPITTLFASYVSLNMKFIITRIKEIIVN